MYGQPALKVRGKLLACLASHKSAEPGTLVVRVGFVERDELIAAAPHAYYLKPHYEGYETVLVRMSRISEEELRGLLMMSWRFVTGKERKSRAKRSVL